MQRTQARAAADRPFGALPDAAAFAGLAGLDDAGQTRVLSAIAAKIGAARRPGVSSDIPAGATYLAQFVVHDLAFVSRTAHTDARIDLDLGLIYGDGPKHDAFCYQVPTEAGTPRHLLRIGRTRPTQTSPAWGAPRDLPRIACPHFDARPIEAKSEVLVPNGFSDSNALLAQMQTLWMLAHNAYATRLGEGRRPGAAFELARAVNRRIYRDVVRADLLGTWLMPKFRARYAAGRARRLWPGALGAVPPEFMAGVGRLGHGLVREIYALSDATPMMGLRDLVRHTGSGRPHEMPLTEDWLVDFSRFFEIGASVPQRARALGPHVARPFATDAAAAGSSAPAEPLVLRDLRGCASGGLRSVRSLIAAARRQDAQVLEGCFAQDETVWTGHVRRWLGETGLAEAEIGRLAQDPPLTLFLMLEAEADTDGRSLGGLGSVLMGETLCAALDAGAQNDPAEEECGMAEIFQAPAPTRIAEMIQFLQSHYHFADGARLHAPETRQTPTAGRRAASHRDSNKEIAMLNIQSAPAKSTALVEVADYIEMGRVVAQWAADPATRPRTVQELREQLDGIAVVPARIEKVEFVQSTLETLVLRLPVKEMIEESLETMSDPMHDGRYQMPQFYSDHYRPGFGPVMTALDTLLARVGDYTIAQCR